MRTLLGLLCVSVLCAGASAMPMETVVVDTADGPLTCYVRDSEYLPGTRIVIAGHDGMVQEIPASEASFVGHGWAGPAASAVEGMSATDLASFLYHSLRFELSINGERAVPDYLVLWSSEAEGERIWALRPYYEFPPGYFAAGIHILDGTWSIVDFPCGWWEDCDPFASESLGQNVSGAALEDGAWSVRAQTRVLTLVVYP